MASGCNLVDLMDLPTAKRQIVRLVLRETMMTHDELCRSVERLLDVDSAAVALLLEDLITNQWLVGFSKDDYTVYRVNLVRRSAAHTQAFWSKLGVDPTTAQVSRHASANEGKAMLRGGKRILPNAIWESLESDAQISRDTLLKSIGGRKKPRGEDGSERTRALRKRLFDALDAISDS